MATREFAATIIALISVAVEGNERAAGIADKLSDCLRDLQQHPTKAATLPEIPPARFPDDYRDDPAFDCLIQLCTERLNLKRLTAVAFVAAKSAKVDPPGRPEKRTKSQLFLWYARHWNEIKSSIPHVCLREEELDISE
jgi:hypothetical protein